jgi:hypothetical protein
MELIMRFTRALFIATAFIVAVSTAQAQTATDPQKPSQAQPSPQGKTGPLNTGAGGTPPESPQGETPPNMQATSPGAAEAPKGK